MKNIFSISVIAAVTVLFLSSSGHAISLSFVPATQSAAKGNIATVAVNISGLVSGAAPSLGAFDLFVNFNPSILSFNGATFGGNPGVSDQLQLGPACTSAVLCGSVPGANSVELFELSNALIADLNNLQVDSFTLATLKFNTLAGGISSLTFSGIILGDALGNRLADVTAGTGSVTVTSTGIPEPSGVVLLGAGLMGLVISGRVKLLFEPSPKRGS